LPSSTSSNGSDSPNINPRKKNSTSSESKSKSKKKNLVDLKLDPVLKNAEGDFSITKNGTFQFNDIQLSRSGFVQRAKSPPMLVKNNVKTDSTDVISPSFSYEDINNCDKMELGRGATATVYLVKVHDHNYALKVMPIRGNDDYDISLKQIASEIKNLFLIMDCPYIVRLYEVFYVDHSIKILLEYMDCGSMEDLYSKFGQFPEAVLSEISCQVLKGLMYLREKKIIHRDIKPSNILLNQNGEAKLGDFGLSKQTTGSLEHFDSYRGTFTYMSPERLKGENYSFDADIYSLGATIAECAKTSDTNNGLKNNPTIWEVLNKSEHILLNNQSTTLPDTIGGGKFSPELEKFVKAMSQQDPSKRPSSKDLLNYEFITKYASDKPYHSIQWLKDKVINDKKLKKDEKEIHSTVVGEDPLEALKKAGLGSFVNTL